MSLRDVAPIAAALLLAACAAAPSPKPGVDPSLVAARPLAGNGVALVLSGGSARGFAHVGVLKALDAAGLRPDLIVGCSAGAIIGSLYASGLSAAGVEAAVSRLDGWIFSQVAQPGVAFLTSSLGLVRSDGLEGFVDREAARQSIEEYPIAFAAVATDLHTGRPQVFNAGDGGKAVSASSAVPGLMTPVEIRGRRFTDCQVSSPLPVEVARTLGARRVIAVDVIYPPEDAVLTGTLRVLFQAFAIAAYRIKELETQDADLVITPELGSTSGQWSFKDRERLIAAGEATTRDMIPRLKLLFGK